MHGDLMAPSLHLRVLCASVVKLLFCITWWSGEKGEIRQAFSDAQHIKRGFAGVIISPHGGFAAGHFASARNKIPPVGPVIYGVQYKALVPRIIADVRLAEQSVQHGETSLPVAPACLAQIIPEPQQSLRGNRGCRAVNGFLVIAGV